MVAGTCREGVKEGRWENGRKAERQGDKENEQKKKDKNVKINERKKCRQKTKKKLKWLISEWSLFILLLFYFIL